MSVPDPIPTGVQRIEFTVKLSSASWQITSARIAEAIRRWPGGTPIIYAGALAFTGEDGNPSITVSLEGQRRVVRGAVHLAVHTPLGRATLAALIDAALVSAGAVTPPSDIANALVQSRSLSASAAAAVSSASMTLRGAPTPRAPRATSRAPAGVPTPTVPVPPVPLSVTERIASGPVVDATDPTRVGDQQHVVSLTTVTDMVAANDLSGLAWIGGGTVALVVALVVIYRAVRSK